MLSLVAKLNNHVTRRPAPDVRNHADARSPAGVYNVDPEPLERRLRGQVTWASPPSAARSAASRARSTPPATRPCSRAPSTSPRSTPATRTATATCRRPEFFDAEQHPQISFHSTATEPAGDGQITLTGEITIKGITKPIELTGEVAENGEDPWGNERIGLELEGKIDRREFDLKWNQTLPNGNLLVANEVKLLVSVSAVKAANPMRILAISGSLRAASHNTALLRAAAELAPEGVEVELYEDLELARPPTTRTATPTIRPPRWRVCARRSRAPTRCCSRPRSTTRTMPGQLKHVVDWASRPHGPGVRAVGQAGGRDRRQHDRLRRHVGAGPPAQGARASPVRACSTPSCPVAKAHERFDDDGELTDPETRERLAETWSRPRRPPLATRRSGLASESMDPMSDLAPTSMPAAQRSLRTPRWARSA